MESQADPQPPKGGDDSTKVQFGLKWTALSMVLFRFARLGTTIVLARILTKSDFGVVTMAMAFILAFQALRDVGFGPAFVQRRGLDEAAEARLASTMFWVVVAINVAMFLVGWFVAPFAASAFPDLDGLASVMRGVFCLLLIEALSTTPTAILQKRLEFGLIATGEMVGIGLHATLSIVFALLGFGAWAIVLGTLGSRLCQTLLVLRLAGWRPSFTFDPASARELFGFGRYLWGNSLLAASSKVVDKMLVGRVLGDVALGTYGNAYNLCTTASKPIYSIVLRVTFPALSKIQNDAPAMRAAFRSAVAAVALVTVPLSVGLSLTATDFVTVVYGERWQDMGPLVEILAFYGIVMSLASITAPVLMATGRVRSLFLFALLGQIAMVGLFVLLSGGGAIGIAAGLLASAVLSEGIAFSYASKAIGLPIAEAATPILRVGAAALVMAVCVMLVQAATQDLAVWARLFIAVAVGIAGYGVGTFLVNRDGFRSSWTGMRSVLVAKGRLA